MEIIIGIFIAGFPLLFIELINRKFNLPAELSRKLVHVLSALAVISLTLFLNLNQIVFVSVVFCLILFLSRFTKIWTSLYRVKRKSWGEVAFPFGVLAASVVSPNTKTFICAIAIMGFADTVAALIGQKFGKHRIKYTTKTIEGSSSFTFTTSLIFLLCGYTNLAVIIPGLALLTITELVSSSGTDNFTIPFIAALYFRLVISLI